MNETTQGSQSLALGLALTAAPQLVEGSRRSSVAGIGSADLLSAALHQCDSRAFGESSVWNLLPNGERVKLHRRLLH